MRQESMFTETSEKQGGVATSHKARIIELLRLYSGRGKTLAEISAPRILGRSIRTLRTYCAAGHIAFPDWVPRSIRPKKPAKKKRGSDG